MSRRKNHVEHPNHERWLVSYADFITLMFAFFVVMFASSQTDKARARMVSDSVRQALEQGGFPAAVREVLGGTVDDKGKGNAMMKGPGGSERTTKDLPPTPPPETAELLPSLNFLSQELRDEIKNGKLQIALEPRGLVVSLRQSAFFPSGEDTIDPATYDSIEKIAKVVCGLPNLVRLEGHTDSVPIHTARFKSNWELAAARSIAMMEVFAGFGVPRTRMAIAGYADTMPVETNETEAGRARNRRVDLVIVNQRVLMAEPKAGEVVGMMPSNHAHKPERQSGNVVAEKQPNPPPRAAR